MANYNTPWNKGQKQSEDVLRSKKSAYYKANRERLIKGVAANRKAKADKYKEYMKWYAIQKKYGVTKEMYQAMVSNQKNKCAICQKKSIRVIDHCHTTGKVRGLLCHGCNRDLAILDNPELLASAQRYKRGAQ